MKETFLGLLMKNFREMFREKRRNSIMLVFPLVMCGVIYLFFMNSQVEKTFLEPINIGIIDNDNSIYSRILIKNYKNNDSFTDFVNISVGSYEDINAIFSQGEVEAVIEIPKGFSDSLLRFEHVPIQVRVNYNNPLKAVLLKNVLKSYEDFIKAVEVGVLLLYDKMKDLNMDKEEISLYNNEISYELIFTSLGRNEFFNYNIIRNIPSTTSVNYFFIAIIMIFLMYIAIFTAVDLIKERETKCFERLKTTRISIIVYLWSKLISSTTFIFLTVSIWFLIITLATNLTIHNNLALIICYIIACIFFAVSLAIFMSSIFSNNESVFLVSNVFIFINAVIGGSIIPIHYMPSVIQSISIVSPNYWMIKGMLYIESGYQVQSGIVIMGVILIISLILTYVAHFRYKRNLL